MPARHPEVPAFRDEFLDSLATAIAKRAKSLKHHSRAFDCARDTDDAGEVLRLEVDTLEERPTRVRFMVWQDGHLWIGVHQPNPRSKGGWDFALQRSGNVLGLEPSEIVERIERTLSAVYGWTRDGDAATQVEGIWEPARLEPGG